MAGRSPWAFFSEPAGDVNFNGGLNSAGGNLSLQDNESSGLQNVDFNFLGSVLKRNGYTVLGIPTSTISQQTGSTGWSVGNDSNTQYYVGQSFTIPVNGSITSIAISFGATTGTPTGGITATIQTNNAGAPSGTLVIASATVTNASITASATNTFTFTTPVALNSGTTYWIVFQPASVQSNNNYWMINSASGTPYANGVLSENTSGTWSSQTGYSINFLINYYNLYASDGLWWYESTQSSSLTYYFIAINGGRVYYMSGFSGNWIDITGSNTITAGNICCFENFFNILYITNGVNAPFQISGNGTSQIIPSLQQNSYTFQVAGVVTAPTVGATYTNNSVTFTVVGTNLVVGAVGMAGTITATGSGAPTTIGTLNKASGTGDTNITYTVYGANTNITTAKYVEQYNNYLFLANVTANGVYYPTRIYWSNLQDTTTWLQSSFIEVSENDGQQITGMKVLGNNLIIFKTRSIYIISFTGDPDVPFILQGGGKANSDVGCVSHFSIQEVQNGLVFLSPDGLYYFDGFNSSKISDRINPTILGLNQTQLQNARSCVQRIKHRYLIAIPSSSSSTNDTIITWDWYLNAFSVYQGMAPSTMCTTYNNGFTEQIWFGDYNGYYYQMDTTNSNDYPLGVQTAINAYYYTNWKTFGDLIDEMVIPHCVVYFQLNSATLSFSYSYDLVSGDTYAIPISTNSTGGLYGTAVYGTDVFGSVGGGVSRIDLDGRGKIARFKFSNANLNETFRVDGLGEYPSVETEE